MMPDYTGRRYRYGLDLILSYWIFAWYLLYIAHVPVSSPKLALMCALFINALSVIFMIYTRVSLLRIVLFILVQVCIKVVPLYTLRKQKVAWQHDIVVLGIVCIVYVVWLHVNNTSVDEIYIKHRFTPVTDILIQYIPALK